MTTTTTRQGTLLSAQVRDRWLFIAELRELRLTVAAVTEPLPCPPTGPCSVPSGGTARRRDAGSRSGSRGSGRLAHLETGR